MQQPLAWRLAEIQACTVTFSARKPCTASNELQTSYDGTGRAHTEALAVLPCAVAHLIAVKVQM